MAVSESVIREKQEKFVECVEEELKRQRQLHPDVHPSIEHSLFVLLEEVHELKDELYKKEHWRSIADIHEEACQIAASAIRLMVDCDIRKDQGYKHHEHYKHAA